MKFILNSTLFNVFLSIIESELMAEKDQSRKVKQISWVNVTNYRYFQLWTLQAEADVRRQVKK